MIYYSNCGKLSKNLLVVVTVHSSYDASYSKCRTYEQKYFYGRGKH
jgi:hypothetical protein